ncbi:MAG: response regulator [Polyangiales bacterium]
MSPQVLIVDDSLTVRMNLAEAYGAAGFRALPCATAERARELLRHERIDALVLDVMLPDTDGIELLREVRASESGKELAILMLSSEAEVHDRIRGLRTGADEYVGKPYDVGYVIAKTRELLRARSAERGARPVLVIDDSPTFRMALVQALEAAHYVVVAADSGEAGLHAAAARFPAAVIVDGMLPGIDGTAVIRQLRLDAALRTVPCILLTAGREADDELRALESGADAFVRKDEDTAMVLAKLSALLRGSQTTTHAEGTSLLAPKKVLAVDHDPSDRERLASVLRQHGYEVIAARSGEEALELLMVQAVDCVLIELNMPGLGGAETCRRLKSSSVLRDMPVIVLSALEERESMLAALALGADDYLPKTAEPPVLLARLRAQLRRRQFEDETRSVREQFLRGQLEAAAAQNARELAAARATMVEVLELKNQELQRAYRALQDTQARLVQSAKLASLGELVAGVAHEINNPLAFSLAHLNTVQRSLERVESQLLAATFSPAQEPWDKAKSRLREMALGLDRIRELVVKLRTFSRLDEGEQKVVSIRECIEALLTILQHRWKDRILVETLFGEPDQIDCYPSQLTQAIMNLVANAIDAIKGAGTIRIQTGACPTGYEISVSDSGTGIAPELRERVLEPFFTTKPVGAGTGLGLSITDSIVRRHGGTLELSDAEGGGTRATIRLPDPTTSGGPAC